ncbi:MAG: hypothetical protein LBP26_05005 [Clostridiales bacterium]|jgi:hypothetical protein|nr:hypothetical protein [Clostridiales bacterium]
MDTRGVPGGLPQYVVAANIPEIISLLVNYKSVITTFGMNDYDYLLNISSRLGRTKHASLSLDGMFHGFKLSNMPFEFYLDLAWEAWHQIMIGYAHEFTHTAECRY